LKIRKEVVKKDERKRNRRDRRFSQRVVYTKYFRYTAMIELKLERRENDRS